MDPNNLPISLNLTAGQVNYILQTLAARPYGEVSNLVEQIKAQGDAQVAAQREMPATAQPDSGA